MGVKTVITLEDLPHSLRIKTLKASTDGVMDSVYFLDDAQVLKIFENANEDIVTEELKLLAHCGSLPIARAAGGVLCIRNKPALIYHRCHGKSLKNADIEDIQQIGAFLKALHTHTTALQSTNTKLFEKSRLEEMIRESDMALFETLFKRIDLTLRDDGIIHGDLFMDNALFNEGSLSCVIDFTQACNGDFLFDLAVVDLSWCDNESKTEALLESYGATLSTEEFQAYREYATLFYCVNRFLNGGNYQELLERLL